VINENLSKEERRQRGRFACSCPERILTERKVLEQGDWESRHRGDKKIDIPMFLERTEKICGEV